MRQTATWVADLCERLVQASGTQAKFAIIGMAARELGFEHCAFGLRKALPFSAPKTIFLNDQPAAWQARYAEAGYLDVDPTVRRGAVDATPQLWNDALFRSAPQLWHEAQSAGLKHGWAQSSLDAAGVGSMLTLSRSAEPVSPAELRHKEPQMRDLVSVAHLVLGQPASTERNVRRADLSAREREVLCRAADGMTAEQIAQRLAISVDTVSFHFKKATSRLGTAGRTAAVARAQLLRLLD